MKRCAALLSLLAGAVHAQSPAPQGCRPRAPLVGRELSGEAADRLRVAAGTQRLPRPGEYALRDGRMLAQGGAGQSGVVYLAREFAERRAILVEELRFRGVAEGQSFSPLRAILDDGAHFSSEAGALVQRLAARLGREHLTLGAAGVDEYASRFRAAHCRRDVPLLRELTAFAGARVIERVAAIPAQRAGAASPPAATGAPAAWSTREVDGVVEPVIELSAKSERRALSPFAAAARLLDEDDARLEPILDELLAPPPAPTPAPAAPVVNRPAGAPDGGAAPAAPGSGRPAASPDGGAGVGR